MFNTARLRLTGWYMLILTVVVAVLSYALYHLLTLVQAAELHAAVHRGAGRAIARIFANDEVTLAYQILAVDVAVLLLSAAGAYLLAGRTLEPIREVIERQRRFAGAASHELRTPLTALQGNLEVALLRPRTSHEYETILRGAVADTEQMGRLVTDLVMLARAESEAGVVAMAPISLRKVIQEAVEKIGVQAERKGQRIDMDLLDALPARGDALKLRQAVLNLLENAVRYTPEGGVIRVAARRDRGRAVIEVRDTGPGIPTEHQRHLFEPFYQVDAARSASGHVGLGLSLVAWIVRAHGGTIGVQSQQGVGTVFSVSLPLAG